MTATHPVEQPIFQAVLWPHRSLSPSGFRTLMILVCLASTLASLPFFIMGAWPVIGFLGLDILLLYWAFRWSYRTARAREEVTLTPLELNVRKVSHWGEADSFTFNPAWVRIHREEDDEFGLMRFAVAERRRMVDLGGFLDPGERASFARDFTAALGEAKRGLRFS